MTIVLTGGGSGGHITPILAVAAELKKRDPAVKLIYIGQTGDNLGDIPAQDPNFDEVYTVRAGKFRRYHNRGLRQLTYFSTIAKNIRDFFYVLIGIWQSRQLMKRLQPSIVFSRGGFVSVPVCLGAALRHVPYVTHDSDSLPSLANRIIARWAKLHAVALPKEIYPYPQAKTITTGIPLSENFVPATPRLKRHYRKLLKLPEEAKVLFIIGGGLGSQIVNRAVSEAIPHLMHEYRDLYVIHGVGRANLDDMEAYYQEHLTVPQQQRLQVYDFISDVYRYSGAADVVITRAGATNLAEFTVQGKACIIIPSPVLTGGHQLKNAQYLAEQGAAVVIDESELQADPNRLAKQVSELLKSPAKQQALGEALLQFATPHATEKLADLLLEKASST